MKFIQSLKINSAYSDRPTLLMSGWQTPEHHWMSWALSASLLHRYYGQVELITDEAGKYVLIDLLKLPYSSVRVDLSRFNYFPPNLWILSKIYAQSLQTEAFLHVDGDVYIWKPFEESLLSGELIAQNLERNFSFYSSSIQYIKENNGFIPSYINKNIDNYWACNAGIIGGNSLSFFAAYRDEVFNMVERNSIILSKKEGTEVNMFLEQAMLKYLADAMGVDTKYYSDIVVDDSTYPDLANFKSVPTQKTYLHALGVYKTNKQVLSDLSDCLRREFPDTYYHVLNVCRRINGPLSYPVYEMPGLKPAEHTASYFIDLKEKYNKNKINKKENFWNYHYAKRMIACEHAYKIFSFSKDDFFLQKLVVDSDVNITEIYNPDISQTLHLVDCRYLNTVRIVLDNIDMILLDAFLETTSILEAVNTVTAYANRQKNATEVDSECTLHNILFRRIRNFIEIGALIMANSD